MLGHLTLFISSCTPGANSFMYLLIPVWPSAVAHNSSWNKSKIHCIIDATFREKLFTARGKKKITFNLCSNSSVLIGFVLWLKEPDFTPLINKADCLISIILLCVCLSIAELCSFVICKLSFILKFVTIILCKLLNANIVILSVKSAKVRIKIKQSLKGQGGRDNMKN